MAANEHKNLSDINRHNPKGLENATNDTILSKSIGTGATNTDGNLVWQDKKSMGVTNHKFQGYTIAGTSNYAYGEDINDTKSPFQMDVDYGSSTVSSGSITPQNFFRIGQGIVISENSTVTSINGWLTNNQTSVVTIAICKVTPVDDVSTSVTPVVINEIALSGRGSNSKGITINTTTITNAALSVGDIIFPMVKQVGSGSIVYMNFNIQTTTF